MATHPSILLIEDSPGECELFRLALAQTSLDIALYTEHDAETAFHFLQDRISHRPELFHQYTPSEAAGVVSTARVERGPSEAARSASTETMPAALQSSISLQKGGLNRSPTARTFSPSQPSARQDALFPEGAHSDRAASASTGDRSGLPSLILLDLHLRGQNGCDFLKRLRSDPRFAAIPVVVFTTSDDQNDLARCYAGGANGYVVKPGTFVELVHCTTDLCRYWLTWNRSPSMVETKC